MSIDLNIFNLVYFLAGRFWLLDWLGVFFADYLAYILVVAAIVLGFTIKSKKEKLYYFLFIALSTILSRAVVTEVIRFFYVRGRPFVVLRFQPLLGNETFSSFPSGHAAFFFALGFAVYYFNKKAGLWFLASALLMGIARIFVGVHWPSDILGGAVLGALSVYVITLSLKLKRQPAGVADGSLPGHNAPEGA